MVGEEDQHPRQLAVLRADLYFKMTAKVTTRNRKRRAAIVQSPSANKKMKPVPMLSGLWDLLPPELVDAILDMCTARQLAKLETTCSYWRQTQMIANIAEVRMRAVPRARGMEPNRKVHENYTSLLHFVLGQSAAAAQATAVAFGSNHTAALLINPSLDGRTGHHSLYTFGRGFYGQLGHGNYEAQATPKQLCIGYQICIDQPDVEEEITPAVVASGNEFTATITRRGQLLTWGLGSRGELGHEMPSAGEANYPMRTLLSTRPNLRIVSVACGASHLLAISEQGCVWSCGRNMDGQLGNATFADGMQLKPVVGIRGQRVVSCAAGISHSMALASDGSLYTWGGGKYGQLGHSSLQAVQLMVPNQAIVLATPQKISMLEPALLQPWKRVTSIAAGGHHGSAVTVGGEVLMFGRNKHGQLGTGDFNDRWRPTEVAPTYTGKGRENFRAVQVVCGKQHTLGLIANNGRVMSFACGNNVFGQLGLGNWQPVNTMTPIPKLQFQDVVALQAGDFSSAAICDSGDVYLWGRNDCNQLGVGDDMSRCSPVLLEGFKAVHPDKTLRKSKRTAPRMRPSVPLTLAPPKTTQTNKLAGWLSGGEVRREEDKMVGDVTKRV
ncbi:regulator of chromosome condensation 1/beta-lactamase-inhibitor protein II [Scenedesmus sp. NREL 46B-D3]|nr:regulator of chromosome condensation 1/beta-lactamase-inhibitor protein II [Scenedesmus sp. NREL 46B-D3]